MTISTPIVDLQPQFILDKRLAADTVALGDLSLSRLLLMNDARFPWLILVPRREGLRELHALADADYHTVTGEIRHVSQCLQRITNADKMNVAALGNMVPQLHIHIIARRMQDAAWPKPVWSVPQAEPYGETALKEAVKNLKQVFELP